MQVKTYLTEPLVLNKQKVLNEIVKLLTCSEFSLSTGNLIDLPEVLEKIRAKLQLYKGFPVTSSDLHVRAIVTQNLFQMFRWNDLYPLSTRQLQVDAEPSNKEFESISAIKSFWFIISSLFSSFSEIDGSLFLVFSNPL